MTLLYTSPRAPNPYKLIQKMGYFLCYGAAITPTQHISHAMEVGGSFP